MCKLITYYAILLKIRMCMKQITLLLMALCATAYGQTPENGDESNNVAAVPEAASVTEQEETVEPTQPRRSSLLKSNARLRGGEKATTGRFYVGAFGGAGFAQDSGSASIQPGAVPVSVGGGNAYFGGLKLGYETSGYQVSDWLVIRPALELESYANFAENTQATTAVGTVTHDLQVISITLNPLLRFEFVERVVPYVGGGFGGAFAEATGASTTIGGGGTLSDQDAIALSLQAIAGLEFIIVEKFSIFAEYKYMYLGNMDFGFSNPAIGTLEYSNYTQHMIGGGLRYKF